MDRQFPVKNEMPKVTILPFASKSKTSKWSKPNIERAERLINEKFNDRTRVKTIDIAKVIAEKWEISIAENKISF